MNCRGGDKCWPNERNLSSKFEFRFILIFLSDSHVLIQIVEVEIFT